MLASPVHAHRTRTARYRIVIAAAILLGVVASKLDAAPTAPVFLRSGAPQASPRVSSKTPFASRPIKLSGCLSRMNRMPEFRSSTRPAPFCFLSVVSVRTQASFRAPTVSRSLPPLAMSSSATSVATRSAGSRARARTS